MKILLFSTSFLFLFLSFELTAQDEQLMNNVIPPSPNSASLGLYGEIPVDKYNGIPNISIPLYSIQVDDISVPVSLSFHSSSHKVGSMASCVGYGWSLNAGGLISRSMHGGPDESGFFINIDSVLNWERDNILENVFDSFLPGVSSERVRALKERMWLTHFYGWDTQPDIFYYNFPAGSGKFLFKKNASVVQMPFQDHVLQPINLSIGDNYTNKGSIGGFLVKDMAGMVYTFDKTEKTQVNYGNPSGKPDDYFNSSWYLSKIQSQRSGKFVNFSYSNPVQLYDVPLNSYSVTERSTQITGDYSVSYGSSSTLSLTDCIYLQTISWESGTVRFYYSGGRMDIVSGGQKLDSIRIENRVGERIKSFYFTYDYFNTNVQLKLLSITEKGSDGNALPPHTFEYYEDDVMPAHDSNAQDHFGYFNKASNATLVPAYTNILANPVNGADRETNTSVATLGILKRLHYPTGGYSEFLYSPNDFYSGQTPTVPGTTTETSSVAVAENCDEDGLLFYNAQGFAVRGLRCANAWQQQFKTPSASPYYTLTISLEYDPVNIPSISPGDLTVQLFDVAHSTTNPSEEYHPTSLTNYTYNLGSTIKSNTTYLLKVETLVPATRLTARLSYVVTTGPSGNNAINSYTSGVRIIEIDHHDDKGLARSIRYNYTLKDNPDRSSGVLLAHTPVYSYRYYNFESPQEGTVDNIVHNASPSGLLGTFQGSHILYKEVSEYETNLGSKRSYYSTFFQQPTLTFFQTPASFEPPSFFWKNGNLVKEEIVDQNNVLLKRLEHIYKYNIVDTVKGFVFGLYGKAGPELYENQFSYAVTKQYSGWAELDTTVETTYSNSQNLVSLANYRYGNGLILPTAEDYSTSDGISIHQETQYLNDRLNHIISPVQEKKLFKGANMISRKKYNYAQGKVTAIEEYSTDNVLAHTTTYADYNGLKPSYIQTSSGIKNLYIWGYNNTLPVAKAVNASPGQVFYEGFETTGTLSTQAKAGQRLLNGDYTFTPPNDFTPAAGSIVSYWYWENEVWNHAVAPYAGGSLQISDGSMIDEVMIYPKDAEVDTYTFKEGIGIFTTADANGQTTYYQYDNFGRLKMILDENKKILKSFNYNLQGQAGNYNYVSETTLQIGEADPTQLSSLNAYEKSISTHYYDGLGRLRQTVAAQGSPNQLDIVQPLAYDAFGRESIHYLPYVSSEQNGNYKENSLGATTSDYTSSPQHIFYNNGAADKIADDSKPYAVKLFEASPLNRVLKQGSDGAAWQPDISPYTAPTDHTQTHSYETNVTGEVIFFLFNAETGLIIPSGSYDVNQLFANKTKDEHGNEVIEYVDKEGHVVCKKVQYGMNGLSKLYAETYYIYNDLGDLAVVLPPEAVKSILSSTP